MIPETSSGVPGPERERVLNLTDYLIKIAEHRTPIIRNVDKYDHLLWLSDIPHLRGCYTQVWGFEEGHEPDHWLELQNQPEPPLPAVPNVCKDWVDYSTLKNKQDLPQLRDSIVKEIPNPAWKIDSELPRVIDQINNLVDYPNVKTVWNNYVEKRWKPWLERHEDWEKIHRPYSKLFQIYQQQLRSREDYELILSFGLLTWKSTTNHQVRRHLIVVDVELEFEPKLATFTLVPSKSGADFRLEIDMLDIDDQPAETGADAKSALSELEIQIGDRSHIEGILRAVANSINSRSQYKDSLEAMTPRWTEQPVVEYAPALVLRRRSTRGLTETLRSIRDAVEAGGTIPANFGDLAEVSGPRGEDISREPDDRLLRDDRIFFPLLANDEQRRIVARLNSQKSVLVQGPPGTGKSQTIVNLICHLLATGRRILITAKTPRALDVIERLMPPQLRSLCISRLGQGSEEHRSLERSVNGILEKNQEWDEDIVAEKIDRLELKYDSKQRKLARVSRMQRRLRKLESHSHKVVDGVYEGTSARIAEEWSKAAPKYSWFKDSANLGVNCEFSAEDLRNILAELRHFSPELRKQLQLELPELVPSIDDFEKLVNREKRVHKRMKLVERDADLELSQALQSTSKSQLIDAMRERLTAYLTAYRSNVRKLQLSGNRWVRDVLNSVATDGYADWQNLCDQTELTLAEIDELIGVVENRDIWIPSTVDFTEAQELCSSMQRHLEAGGSLGWWILAPRIAIRFRKRLKQVRIDGSRCDNNKGVSQLQCELKLRTHLENIRDRWKGIVDLPEGNHASQISKLRSLYSALRDALLGVLVQDSIQAIRECRIRGYRVIDELDWTDEVRIEQLISSCELALLRLDIAQISDQFLTISSALPTGRNPHPVVKWLRKAIKDRHIPQYHEYIRVVNELMSERNRMQIIDEKTTRLQRSLPELAKELLRTVGNEEWDHRLSSFDQAWVWAQVRSWLCDFFKGRSIESLSKTSQRLEDDIRHYIAEIASLKAWSFCFSRLDDDHLGSMEAWLQSMDRFGKGTGKHAARHRRDALNHLQNCKGAIPAWVMPIHRVWDTVNAEPEFFDCVIVDEASQCGLESLPLLYLGRRVLVVGDDKQISPEAIGLDQSNVQPWAREYLGEFKFGSTFDVRSSLFDHGRVRFGKHKVTLREHFRCMPEIIKFSNDLCYSDTPLIPLRRYGPDRLAPVQHQRVEDGYRSGSASNAINIPEANAVVDRIVKMCRDRRYDGKSLGVISLQGQKQAVEIEHLLLERLGPEEIKRRRLICGTAYSFQGDERDVMLLSMVAAANERIGTLTKRSDERRFNVAASRARDQMILFHSVHSDELSSKCLRRRLLDFFQGTHLQQVDGIGLSQLEQLALRANRQTDPPPRKFDSWFEVDVALELIHKGFDVIPQYEVSGRRIDLVVVGSSSQLAVECDGDRWHGKDAYEQDMARQRQLERCGWEFFRVRQSRFYADRGNVLNELWAALGDRDIVAGSGASDLKTEAAGVDEIASEVPVDVPNPAPTSGSGDLFSSTSRVGKITNSEIRNAMLGAIEECPNRSCTIDSLTPRALKFLGIVTRGKPWMEFAKRVEQMTKVLEMEGRIEGYRSKNERVRLL